MDDGESGMKEPPVIVQILLRLRVRDLAHTVLFSERVLLFLLDLAALSHLDKIGRNVPMDPRLRARTYLWKGRRQQYKGSSMLTCSSHPVSMNSADVRRKSSVIVSHVSMGQ